MKLTNILEWDKGLGGVKTAIGNGSILALFDGPNLTGLRIRGCGSRSLLKLQLTELPIKWVSASWYSMWRWMQRQKASKML